MPSAMWHGMGGEAGTAHCDTAWHGGRDWQCLVRCGMAWEERLAVFSVIWHDIVREAGDIQFDDMTKSERLAVPIVM